MPIINRYSPIHFMSYFILSGLVLDKFLSDLHPVRSVHQCIISGRKLGYVHRMQGGGFKFQMKTQHLIANAIIQSQFSITSHTAAYTKYQSIISYLIGLQCKRMKIRNIYL